VDSILPGHTAAGSRAAVIDIQNQITSLARPQSNAGAPCQSKIATTPVSQKADQSPEKTKINWNQDLLETLKLIFFAQDRGRLTMEHGDLAIVRIDVLQPGVAFPH
jgi:hypothetical protein